MLYSRSHEFELIPQIIAQSLVPDWLREAGGSKGIQGDLRAVGIRSPAALRAAFSGLVWRSR